MHRHGSALEEAHELHVRDRRAHVVHDFQRRAGSIRQAGVRHLPCSSIHSSCHTRMSPPPFVVSLVRQSPGEFVEALRSDIEQAVTLVLDAVVQRYQESGSLLVTMILAMSSMKIWVGLPSRIAGTNSERALAAPTASTSLRGTFGSIA